MIKSEFLKGLRYKSIRSIKYDLDELLKERMRIAWEHGYKMGADHEDKEFDDYYDTL